MCGIVCVCTCTLVHACTRMHTCLCVCCGKREGKSQLSYVKCSLFAYTKKLRGWLTWLLSCEEFIVEFKQ